MIEHARMPSRRECWRAGSEVPRHCHRYAYAALVLSGGYEECGNRGRFRVGPGDVLVHAAFDAHLDRFAKSDTEILNLVLREPLPWQLWSGRVTDADTIVRLSEHDPAMAVAVLSSMIAAAPRAEQDWPDLLAANIANNPGFSLGRWARDVGLAPETLSRKFRRLYGVTPARFRAEARARSALFHLARSHEGLAQIAASTGFADQPHMTRAIKAFVGVPPGAFRSRSNRFKTRVRSPA